ncbi:hypothetical protein [Methyloglobulus sp.]|uniref:hypothetical protein n=1 Tax=Methyloglobulus sp. TaxID=2518622 RepID=UPI00398A3B9B
MRHLGRDCRDPEAMDGNTKHHQPFISRMEPFLGYFSHPCVMDSGNPCRNDDVLKISCGLVDYH